MLVLLNLWILKSDVDLYQKERYTGRNAVLAEKEYTDLIVRKAELSANVARLSTPEGVDLELRRKFQVAKPGEVTLIIVPTIATATPPLPEKPTLWQNVMHWFSW